MLVSENTLRDADGILVVRPQGFVAFQALGALSRLGKRYFGFGGGISDQEVLSPIDKALMPTATTSLKPFRTGIMAFDPLLSLRAPTEQSLAELNADLGALVEQLDKLDGAHEASWIFIVPAVADSPSHFLCESWISKFRAKRMLSLVCPPLFGPRDPALWRLSEFFVTQFGSPDGLNSKTKSKLGELSFDVAFVGDIVGLLTSLLTKEEWPSDKALLVPSVQLSLLEWLEMFCRTQGDFVRGQPRGRLELYAAPLKRLWAPPQNDFVESCRSLKRAGLATQNLSLTTEFFPQPVTGPSRALETFARQRRVHGGLASLYPPSRAP